MKKIYIAILILIMTLSAFTTDAYALNYPDINKDLSLEQAVGLLSSYGVINGYPDGNFMPEKDVTRAEMAKIVTIAAGFSEYSKNMTSVYEDMHGHWAESYVELANVLNIVKGISPSKYGPDNTIRFEEAYTMIIRLLGYRDESLIGVWPSNYYAKALELNLFENINTIGEFASRRDVAIMLYNALSCEMVRVRDNNTIYPLGKELLSSMGKKETREVTISDLKSESFDFTNYLFNKWDIYYNNKGNAVYADNPRYNTFKGLVTSLLSNRVIFVTDDYGNVRAFKLPEIPIVINGEKSTFSKLNDSHIRVVYEDESFNGDVIGIVAYKETSVLAMERDDLYTPGSKSFAGKSLPVKSNGEINYNKLHIHGDALSLENIKTNDLVYFYESNDSKSLTLDVVRKQTDGVVTGKQTTENGTFYTVNSISYKTGSNFTFTENVAVNDNVRLILDNNNNIAKIMVLKYGKYPTTYGLVLSSANSINQNASAKIFDEFGGVKNYLLADNSSVVNVFENNNNDLVKQTFLKKNDIVRFDPVQNGTLKIINYIPSPTYIANNYNTETRLLTNGYWISSETFIIYESNGKYQLLEPSQLDSYLVGKAVIGYNSHIDVLYLTQGIKVENAITVTPQVPQTFNGTIYGVIKGVTQIDSSTSHIQFYNNSSVFSVSNVSAAGKKISTMLNYYVKAEISNGTITSIERVIPETDKVKITQVYSTQLLIDSITYMEYSTDLKVYVCTTDKSGNITGFKTGSKSDIKAGSTAQLYDLYGGFDGIIDAVLIYQ